MKVLLTGGKGMLARTISREFSEFEIISTGRPDTDITDAHIFDKRCEIVKPDVVLSLIHI